MKSFKELTGYNKNKFCKAEHVFIEGEGCCFETEEKARKYANNNSSSNWIGLVIDKIKHEGNTVYHYHFTNVWD